MSVFRKGISRKSNSSYDSRCISLFFRPEDLRKSSRYHNLLVILDLKQEVDNDSQPKFLKKGGSSP